MSNQDIRAEVRDAGLKLWEVAYAMGISCDSNFSRKLRRELPVEEKEKVRSVIKQLQAEKKEAS